ncbi:MAG: hypothetical protein H6983_02175 [Ectothiorhodospiraceae bacterium]|nr:hypothetical protein [Ectothiorhodospiraceae bacterium]
MANDRDTARRHALEGAREIAALVARARGRATARVVLFASAWAGEGTTTAVWAVARELREHYRQRTLVIDLDRRGARRSTRGTAPGLTEIGADDVPVAECLREGPAGVSVLAWGGSRAGASPDLDPLPALKRVIDACSDEFDVILVDARPILDDPDTVALARLTDGVVVVVEAGRTRFEVLERVRAALQREDVGILAAVLNKHVRRIPGWLYRLLLQ